MVEDQKERIKKLEAQIVTLKDQKADLEKDAGTVTKKIAATEVYKKLLDVRTAGAIGITGAMLAAVANGWLKLVLAVLTVGAETLYLYKANKEMKYLAEKYVLPVKTFKFQIQK